MRSSLPVCRCDGPGTPGGIGPRIAMLQTALSENSARVLELPSNIPEDAPASAIDNLSVEGKRAVIEFGLRLEVMGYMVFRQLVDVTTANDMAGGTILGYWSRAKAWSEETRRRTRHDEHLEWCEWVTNQIARRCASHPYLPAYRNMPTGINPEELE